MIKKFIALALLSTIAALPAFAVSRDASYSRNVYTITPVTTAAWVQLVASMPYTVQSITVFDSSGQTLLLGVGQSGSEVAQILIPPGGGTFPLGITAGSRVSIKALSANATTGENDINYFY